MAKKHIYEKKEYISKLKEKYCLYFEDHFIPGKHDSLQFVLREIAILQWEIEKLKGEVDVLKGIQK